MEVIIILINGNVIIIQSGGPTAVINSSMVGIVEAILESNKPSIKIYGAKGGLKGLLNNSLVRLDTLTKEKLKSIKYTPGAMLGTCRLKIEGFHLRKIIGIFKVLNINHCFYIGGNGSMYVAEQISNCARELNYPLCTIGVPKSIDNDLDMIDHSPGYASAAKFLIACTEDITLDIVSYEAPKKVTIMETMGRNTGWLAASCSLAEQKSSNCKQLIYIPESPFSLINCLETIEYNYNNDYHTLLIVSEGIRDHQDQLIAAKTLQYDSLNRPKLGGVSWLLKDEIDNNLNIGTRCIDTSIWQRSSSRYISLTDVNEAYNLGYNAWKAALNNEDCVMVTLSRLETSEYMVEYSSVPLSRIAGIEKTVPKHWYDETKKAMNKEFIDYIKPLVKGDVVKPSFDLEQQHVSI
ncbi:diphosphate--fructose-6-phosphate 1-phosphotransferase [Psychrobacillus sp.]|uniref:diphosphate--fructose-6-phosphate 1-phosphotransferase n=1 Tax=Psychrobacillus sp. TaxID=1871623 RepID=UPI0028BEDB16|nr:diphosphate--fructose-6-phosphate 1-phosphotransferase [Psychrobacillus sp.]